MNVKFTGKIIAAGQVQMGTSQNGTQWCSQEYVIDELNQQYPPQVNESGQPIQQNDEYAGGQQKSGLPF